MMAVTLASVGAYLLMKLCLLLYFVYFTLVKLIPKVPETEADEVTGTSLRQMIASQNSGPKIDFKAEIQAATEKKNIQTTLIKLLIWLDLETFAKLYEGEDKNETSDFT